jgi:hypothetical protein
MPQAMPEARSIVFEADLRVSDIRIDYVQHALSAWLRYQAMFSSSRERRQSSPGTAAV